MSVKIQLRRDTTTNWTSSNPVLSVGEIGWDTVLKQGKVGDGVTTWSGLSFVIGGTSLVAGTSNPLMNGTASAGSSANYSRADHVHPTDTSRSPLNISINAQAASYTLVLADNGKMVEMSVASANNLTVPTNASVAFPIGTQITVVQTGAGQTTIVAASGATVNGTPGLKLRAQWSTATLIKRGTDTWLATGDLIA